MHTVLKKTSYRENILDIILRATYAQDQEYVFLNIHLCGQAENAQDVRMHTYARCEPHIDISKPSGEWNVLTRTQMHESQLIVSYAGKLHLIYNQILVAAFRPDTAHKAAARRHTMV